MPNYMLQASYTPESWAAQISHPQNREDEMQQRCAVHGVKVLCFYYAFGEYDVVVIVEAPDNVTAAALAMVVASGGALKTTVLMTSQDRYMAMQQASGATYSPPGALSIMRNAD
jgi:uncharacterized protein with GYD domain